MKTYIEIWVFTVNIFIDISFKIFRIIMIPNFCKKRMKPVKLNILKTLKLNPHAYKQGNFEQDQGKDWQHYTRDRDNGQEEEFKTEKKSGKSTKDFEEFNS